MAKFTPGTWKINGFPGQGNLIIVTTAKRYDGYGRMINTALALILQQGDETEPNANLMSAAPDMHKVLKALIEELSAAEWATPEHAEEILSSIIDRHLSLGIVALAKAEGAR